MIKQIILKNIASYTDEVKLEDLRKINFFYGSNGSGKSTVANLIFDSDNSQYSKVEWVSDYKLKTLVYNDNFVKTYFYESSELKGIYTIGEGTKEIEKQIDKKKDELNKLEENYSGLISTKSETGEKKEKNFNNFQENCWENIFKKYETEFSKIFIGLKNNKEKFANKILEEYNKKNTSELKNLDDLKKEYQIIFNENLEELELLPIIEKNLINKVLSLENNPIMQTKIIGKEDIDIAAMIHKLQNHDWVRQGKEYLEKTFSQKENTYICPFCQQKIPETFKEKFEKYFDETYENNIKELNSLINDYYATEKELDDFFTQLNVIESNRYLEEKKNELDDKKQLLFQILSTNEQRLSDKQRYPSIVISLDSILEIINETNEIIGSIDDKIIKHNNLINKRQDNKNRIKSEIWKFFCNTISSTIQIFNQQRENIEKALNSIGQKIEENEDKQKSIKKEISEFEKQIKSVRPTVEAINQLLEKFGFNGFKLKVSDDDDKYYRIIRPDGSSAKETLSEGERNFIVFLYFFQLIQGVIEPSENINKNKIIVFDDPVSSLDSDVLFIVATLIKKILKDIRDGKGNIKQIFILTHNAFFFKEVTYISLREQSSRRNDTKYFIIRKVNGKSVIDNYENNPIKSTYQLLWEEVKRTDNIDCITLQNSMRRIIEYYFKILANLDNDEIIEKFENENEKKICCSLISWVNVGSHDVFDDINYIPNQNEIDNYKRVFKSIFEITGHIAHYNMMMGVNNDEIR